MIKKILFLVMVTLISITTLYSQDIYIPKDYDTLVEYYLDAVHLYIEAENDNSILIKRVEDSNKKLEKANDIIEKNISFIEKQSESIKELLEAVSVLQDRTSYSDYRHGINLSYGINYYSDNIGFSYNGLFRNSLFYGIGVNIISKEPSIVFSLGYYFK
jgi:histidyl-tRNA synthetase